MRPVGRSRVVVSEAPVELVLASFPEAGKAGITPHYVLQQALNGKQQVTAESEVISLVGANYGRATKNVDMARWLVAVHDPLTQRVTLNPIGHVFPVRSTVKTSQSSSFPDYSSMVRRPQTSRQRRALLFEDFGASKKQRQIAASSANVVSAEQAHGGDYLRSWLQRVQTRR